MSGSIGGVDASIPLQAGKGVPQNMLAANPGQFANALNSINQLKLFPGQMQLQQQAIQSGGIDVAQKQNAAAYSYLTPLLQNPDPQLKDVTNAYGVAHLGGLKVDPYVADAASSFPVNGTPAERKAWVAARVSQSGLSPAERIAANVNPEGPLANTGNALVPTTKGALLGPNPNVVSPAGAPIPMGVSPAQNMQPVTWKDSTGTEHYGTLGQYNQLVNGGAQVSPSTPAQGGAVPQGYTGRYPTPGAQPTPPAAPPQGITGPPPGTVEAGNVTGHANAEQGIALQQAAAGVPQQKALLGNLETALGNFTAGPSADWQKVGKTFVNSVSRFGNIFDPSRIASQDEFNKQALQLAQQQFQTLGGTGTDAKLNSTMHTSPNAALSNLSNKGIIALLKGNADAIAVMNDEWQNHWLPAHDGNTATYGQFVTQFNKQFDPRVFQGMYIAPQDRQQMLSGMSPGEKSQFRQDFNLAVRNGWIPDPRATQQPAASAPQVPTN